MPDDLRGRLSGINIAVVAGGPRIGDVEAGFVAAVFSPTVSVVSGGVLCVVGRRAARFARPRVRALPARRRAARCATS